MLNLRRFKTTHITRRVNAAKAPGSLIGGRYNPPQSMSKRTALRWSLIGPAKTKTKDPLGKDISKTPIDLSGKIYTPNSTKKYTSKVITHTITLEESGQTISKLAQNYFKLQANACRFQILRGEIYASGSMNARSLDASPKATLVAGDKLNRCVRYIESKALAPTSLKSEQLDAIKSMIIYKDENILVINKKPSIAMHAGTNHSTYNLESIMKSLTLYSGDEDLRLVHRLDKDTTGCLIFARTKKAAVELSEMFKSRSDDSRITTRYTALVMGKIDANEYSSGSSHTIITGITTFGEAPNQRQKIVNWHKDFTNMKENEVKKAVTIIKILQSKGQVSLLSNSVFFG